MQLSKKAKIAMQEMPTKAYMPISRSDMARKVLIMSLSITLGDLVLGESVLTASSLKSSVCSGEVGTSSLSFVFCPCPFLTVHKVLFSGPESSGAVFELPLLEGVEISLYVVLVVLPILMTSGSAYEAVDMLEVEVCARVRSGSTATVLLNIHLLAPVTVLCDGSSDALFPTFLFLSGSSPPPSMVLLLL